MAQHTTDVVVVGAGPVGLLLASELALGGARIVLVERLGAPDPTPKAGGFATLASEALERRGLGPALDAEEAAAAEAMKAMSRSLGGQVSPQVGGKGRGGGHFAGLSVLDQELQREPERRARWVAQQPLERVLRAHAARLGAPVWREHTVESFVDTGEGVQVAVRGPGGARAVEAAFLVGCDGGRSTVRKQAGLDFPGTAPTLTGYQLIVDLDHPERLLPLGWRRTPAGMMAYGPTPGRVVVVAFDGPPADREAPVTRDEVEQSLRRVSGADVRVTSLHAATRWTDHARQASTYRRGRVLIAGDAAHVHSPFGGQGLNLGLVDAANLGWKLAATVRGTATDGLLDTYTSERHPVAARALDTTRAQIAIMRPDPQSSAMRDLVAELLTTSPEANRLLGERVSGVTTRYDLGDDDPLVGRLVGNLALTVDGESTRLYALMHDGRAVLVDGDGRASEEGAAWSSRVRVVRADGAQSMLVRPDGCIAWAGRAGGLRAAMERWVGEG